MTEANETNPVGEAQPPVAAQPDLSAQLELLKAKNAELISEKQKVKSTFDDLQKQIAELQSQSSKQKQAKLAEAGEFQQLWKDASATVADKEKRISELEQKLHDSEQSNKVLRRIKNAYKQIAEIKCRGCEKNFTPVIFKGHILQCQRLFEDSFSEIAS